MADQDPISRAIDAGRDVTERGQKVLGDLLRDVTSATDRQSKQVREAVDDLVSSVTSATDRQTKQLAKVVDDQTRQLGKAVDDLRDRSRDNSDRVGELVEKGVQRQLNAMGLATRADIARLEKKVDALTKEVKRVSKKTAKSATRKKAAASTAKKKASGR